MFPLYLFWNYLSPFPWYLGPLLMLGGFVCLWLTRFTATLYPRWGWKYLLFSSLIRPLGIIMIGWAWVEIFSVQPHVPVPEFLGKPLVLICALTTICAGILDGFMRPFWVGFLVLYFLIYPNFFGRIHDYPLFGLALLAFIYEIWALVALGLRRSFLYSRPDDPLIKRGPYKYQRHPQLLAAILLVFAPWMTFWNGYINGAVLALQGLCYLAFIAGIFLITLDEEKDLNQRLGPAWRAYKVWVPGFIRLDRGRGLGWGKSLGLVIISLTITIWSSLDLNDSIFRKRTKYVFIDSEYGYDIKSIDREMSGPNMKANLANWLEHEGMNDETARVFQHMVRSKYPVTLFWCDKIYLPIEPYPALKNRRWPTPPVEKLPFPLYCSNDRTEIAFAFNYDNDSFPHIWLFTCQGSDCHGLLAADDATNTFAPEIQSRLKQP